MAGQDPYTTSVEQVLTKLDAVLAETVATIEAAPDLQQALEAAVRLFDTLKAYKGRAANLRGTVALRIKEAEATSLVTLADRMGVSKARAEQLVKAAREGQEG